MKKIGVILSLSIIMVLMSFSLCFASGLDLLDSYPKDGSDESRPENFMVKLYFNEDVSAKEVQSDNENAFKFTDSKGKELPIKVLYDAKRPKEIWVLVDKILKSDTGYKLSISGDLKVANGDTLGQDKVIKLKTRNVNTDNNVNMGLMGVMMVGMIFFTSYSTKRQLKKQEEEAKTADDIKVNPYKVAKETGKSVEDIVAKTEKEKEKAKQKAEKKNKGKVESSSKISDADDDKANNDNKRVTGPRPISVTGSTFVTGRKAKAEKEREQEAARAAAGTTRPKNATGKSKNKKVTKK
ncbi:MAG: hypothetical protein AAGU75_15135 [Bacillota bacterium]